MDQEEEHKGSEESYESQDENMGWIPWFCSVQGNEFFCEVSEEYIEDDFNLCGLSPLIKDYDRALDTILDVEQDEMDSDIESRLQENAEKLYGLIHARYIVTRNGLYAMHAKFNDGDFGTCPRDLCYGAHVLPCGVSDIMGMSTVKLFCPSCSDIYNPPSSRFNTVDGAFFGTTFPHLYMQTYPDIIHSREAKDGLQIIYQERIFGFKVHSSAVSGPKMKWLRRFIRQEDLALPEDFPRDKKIPLEFLNRGNNGSLDDDMEQGEFQNEEDQVINELEADKSNTIDIKDEILMSENTIPNPEGGDVVGGNEMVS